MFSIVPWYCARPVPNMTAVLSNKSMFGNLRNERKCGKCGASVQDIFINPHCDHVVCAACLRSKPPKSCPTCKGDLAVSAMAPDLTFKFLWQIHSPELAPSNVKTPQRKRQLSTHVETPKSSSSPFMFKTPKTQVKRNGKGETPLHQYCTSGFTKKKGFSLERLKTMIKEGANPNTRDAGGLTPMHEAVIYDDLEILKALLDGGGRVNCYCVPPATPLHVAIERYQNIEITETSLASGILKTLLDYGADLNVKDGFNRLPLEMAKSNPSMFELLSSYKPAIVSRKELLSPEQLPTVHWCKSTNRERQQLQKFASMFNVRMHSAKDQFKPSITHLVVSSSWKPNHVLRRALLCGCYIVSGKWISESIEQEQIRPAADYEVPEPLTSEDKVGFVTRRARMNEMTLMPKLFAGGQFHILANPQQQLSVAERTQISELIVDGGGAILTREPKTAETTGPSPVLFHAPSNSMFAKCSVLILYKYEPPIRFSMPHMKHLPIQWLYECIDGYTIVEW